MKYFLPSISWVYISTIVPLTTKLWLEMARFIFKQPLLSPFLLMFCTSTFYDLVLLRFLMNSKSAWEVTYNLFLPSRYSFIQPLLYTWFPFINVYNNNTIKTCTVSCLTVSDLHHPSSIPHLFGFLITNNSYRSCYLNHPFQLLYYWSLTSLSALMITIKAKHPLHAFWLLIHTTPLWITDYKQEIYDYSSSKRMKKRALEV